MRLRLACILRTAGWLAAILIYLETFIGAYALSLYFEGEAGSFFNGIVVKIICYIGVIYRQIAPVWGIGILPGKVILLSLPAGF